MFDSYYNDGLNAECPIKSHEEITLPCYVCITSYKNVSNSYEKCQQTAASETFHIYLPPDFYITAFSDAT